MALVRRTWLEYLTNPNDKIIKDEYVEQDIMEISSLQTNDIDYTIVDTSIHPLHSSENALTIARSPSKQAPAKAPRRKCKSSIVFYPILIEFKHKTQ